jgi:hypothetical protein
MPVILSLMFGRASVARRTQERRAEARRLEEDVRRVAALTPGAPRRSCITYVVEAFCDDTEPTPEGMPDWHRMEGEEMERLAILSDLVGPYEAARQIFGGHS